MNILAERPEFLHETQPGHYDMSVFEDVLRQPLISEDENNALLGLLKDVVNYPNFESGIGFALVVDGCRKLDTVTGVAEVALGRLFDVVDGIHSRHITKKRQAEGLPPRSDRSKRLGAGLDASLDKLGVLAIIYALTKEDAMPKSATAAIIGINVLSTAATFVDERNHPGVLRSPVKSGKYGMAAINAALLGYGVGHLAKLNARKDETSVESESAASDQPLVKRARLAGNIAAAAGVGLMAKATYSYFQRAST